MQIDRNLILRLEKLARLQLSDEERQGMIEDLNKILKMVEKLDELDTSNVEPLIYLSNQIQFLRSDQVVNQISAQDALKNTPVSKEPYFQVPKVIKQHK